MTPQTQITGLIGHPIAHSKSYAMHNAALQNLKIPAVYLSLPCPTPKDLQNLTSAFRTHAFVGANITTPHKKTIIPLLDQLDGTAQRIGAVNTLCSNNGILVGKNSDAEGFLNALKEDNIEYKNHPIFVIGAGGAARAITHALAPHVTSITIYNRSMARAKQLVIELREQYPECTFDTCIDPTTYCTEPDTILVQCTPLGRKGEIPPHPPLIANMTVVDLLYTQTPLLQKAQQIGAKTQDGNAMLLHQAALSFSWWFSCSPPLTIMREANNPIRSFS
ncbi:MAG: shikimate dehydrogenase [Deltaproteobacteria bacterium]|nr:shikimate dehydrogenase [Deltaproteobacteria bacterium]